MKNRPRVRMGLASALALVALVLLTYVPFAMSDDPPKPTSGEEPHRSPIALALSTDGTRILTANQTSGTVSLVDTAAGRVLAEVATGDKPAGVALAKDGRRGAVTHWYGYDLAVLEVGSEKLEVVGRVAVGPEPRGVVIGDDGKTAYVAVGVSNEVVRVDLDAREVTGRLAVGREPRGLALSPDGTHLLVGNTRSQSLSLISLGSWTVERTFPIKGDNLRQVTFSGDGSTGYVANLRNKGFATTRNNIDLGWVLGQCLTRVRIDDSEPFATLTLDAQGRAAADVYGAAAGRDGQYLAVSCGGTHEVMIFRTDLAKLPWRSLSSRDMIDPSLLKNDGRFRRVAVGGRPTELAFAADGKTLYVANYLDDSIQVVDAVSAKLTHTIPLGGPKELSLVRRGEILFHAAERSFNQWYSCSTCHPDGHTNGLDFDTLNDGRQDLSTAHLRSRKKVPTLRRVSETGPWTWHGWQKSLEDATIESFTKSMQGPRPADDEVKALVAYLNTLEFPRNPFRNPDGSLSPEAQRGEAIFRSSKTACTKCHSGPELTDGKIHIVGLEERDDAYEGYNPPSLRGVYDKDPFLHDGRSKTLRDALTDPHSPEIVSALGTLSESETDDLIAYLKSL
ncbi:40-residue YVTN family beta-propeller repeat-containing protein [Singulisphaera sp. GP187]|uniref:c-type cytochrome n=1 Tax=Singulisphaera sp. GP187 TaxID=1882752 RepID=UPI0009270F4E|nr:c-type cytochrome [Singulisphaera sp. GP187]SIN78121.1 40-residue YVTN family beta-propeller repeat-containing protein [Singulisphaera sp. GP187]